MPINVTPITGRSDRIEDVRSHSGWGVDEQMVTDGSLRALRGKEPDVQQMRVAQDVLRLDETNESWGSGG